MRNPSVTHSRLPWLIFGLLAACNSGLRLGADGGQVDLGATGGSQPSTTAPPTGGTGGGGTGGTLGAGGVPSGVITDSGTGGSAGAPGNAGTGGANVNVRVCPNFPTGSLCYTCDPLPAGRTDGCPPATTFCSNEFDPNAAVRYPAGCTVKYGQYYVPYYPDQLQSAYCDGTGWKCLL
jgi:hypothetical protein